MLDIEATTRTRPGPNEYFMGIALAVRTRADCTGNRVGAVIVKDRRIVSTGYNGTPENIPNCTEGGCHRCANRGEYPSGAGYDLCICVHAEQNALLAAAREVGVRRFVAQSVASFSRYAREGGPVKTEDDPVDPTPPTHLHKGAEAMAHLERVVTDFGGIALRYGAFYGAANDGTIEPVRRR